MTQTHTPTTTITPTGRKTGMLGRIGSAAGGVVRDTVLYGGMTLGLGYLLDNYVYNTPGPLDGPDSEGGGGGGDGPLGVVTGAAEAFMHGAGDTLGFVAGLPGRLVDGISEGFETAQTVTYLITAGVIIGGAIYLYRE